MKIAPQSLQRAGVAEHGHAISQSLHCGAEGVIFSGSFTRKKKTFCGDIFLGNYSEEDSPCLERFMEYRLSGKS
jgi:hypothetical protein